MVVVVVVYLSLQKNVTEAKKLVIKHTQAPRMKTPKHFEPKKVIELN